MYSHRQAAFARPFMRDTLSSTRVHGHCCRRLPKRFPGILMDQVDWSAQFKRCCFSIFSSTDPRWPLPAFHKTHESQSSRLWPKIRNLYSRSVSPVSPASTSHFTFASPSCSRLRMRCAADQRPTSHLSCLQPPMSKWAKETKRR
jgi:hypothetical protein